MRGGRCGRLKAGDGFPEALQTFLRGHDFGARGSAGNARDFRAGAHGFVDDAIFHDSHDHADRPGGHFDRRAVETVIHPRSQMSADLSEGPIAYFMQLARLLSYRQNLGVGDDLIETDKMQVPSNRNNRGAHGRAFYRGLALEIKEIWDGKWVWPLGLEELQGLGAG
jgi:hypothetical protein